MKIHHLDLQNFKCFEKEKFSFNPQFTVLIGDNGKGKSAILDGVAIALGGFLQGIGEAKSRLIHKDEIRLKDFGEHIERQIPAVVEATGSIQDQEITWYRSIENVSGSNTSKGTKSIADIARDLASAVRKGEDIILPVITYFGTGRLWVSKRTRTKTQPKGSRLSLGYRDCLQPI